MFYIASTLSCVFFLLIDWKCFFIEWSKSEIIFFNDNYKNRPQHMKLKRKIQICFWMGFITFVTNQIFFYSSTVQKLIHKREACNDTQNGIIEELIVFHLDHIFDLIPYNHLLGIIAELFNLAMTFYWIFPDIFIMILSIGITYRFQQVNKRVEYFKNRVISNSKWNEVRLHYTELCDLVKFVDKTFEKLIMLAALNNSYLILVQTLHVLAWVIFLFPLLRSCWF